MTAPERPLSLSHAEQSPVASFQASFPSSASSQLPPFEGTSKPQGENANPEKEARVRAQSLPTGNLLFQRSSHAKSYDNVILNQQRPRPQISSQFNATIPLRRKPVVAKAVQPNEKIRPVVIIYPTTTRAPDSTSDQYTKPSDSQLFTKDISYKSVNTIYCECKPNLPARRLQTQATEANHGERFYVCQKAIHERCKFLLWDDGTKDGGDAAVTHSTHPEQPSSPPSRAPSEPPPYNLALPYAPSVSKQEGSDHTMTTYITPQTSYTAYSPPARGIDKRMNQDCTGLFDSSTPPFDPAGETQSNDNITTNRRQGQCALRKENPEGGIDNNILLRPTSEQSPKKETEVTDYHQEEHRLDGEIHFSPTKKRKLGSYMGGCTQEEIPQVPSPVNIGTNAENLDPFDQGFSREEAHAMLDRLFDLRIFIKDVRSRLRDLSLQIDALQRSFTKTRSSVEVEAQVGASTVIPDQGVPTDKVKNVDLPDVQALMTPRDEREPTTSSSSIFNLEEIAIPLRGTQIDASSEDFLLQPIISTFMPLDNLSPLRKLVPYDARASATTCTNRFIEQALLDPLPRLSNYAKGIEPAGLIYMYSIQGSFGYVKIGYTARAVETRLAEWQTTCKHTPHLIFPKSPEEQTIIPYVRRVEALIHAELRHCRVRELQCLCKEINAYGRQKQHIEWFEVDVDRAKEVAMRWSEWMRSDPYEEITPQRWVLRAEHRANIDELARPTPRAEMTKSGSGGSRPLLPKSASAPSKSYLGPGFRVAPLARRSLSPRLSEI